MDTIQSPCLHGWDIVEPNIISKSKLDMLDVDDYPRSQAPAQLSVGGLGMRLLNAHCIVVTLTVRTCNME